RVVDLLPAQLAVDVERDLEDRAVHRRRRQKRGRDEELVWDRAAVGAGYVADERADAEADREEVEQRLEEPGHDDEPAPAIEIQAALEQVESPAAAERHRRE